MTTEETIDKLERYMGYVVTEVTTELAITPDELPARVYFGWCFNGEVRSESIQVNGFMSSGHMKDMLALLVKEVVKSQKPDVVVLVSEMFMRVMSREQHKDYEMPKGGLKNDSASLNILGFVLSAYGYRGVTYFERKGNSIQTNDAVPDIPIHKMKPEEIEDYGKHQPRFENFFGDIPAT